MTSKAFGFSVFFEVSCGSKVGRRVLPQEILHKSHEIIHRHLKHNLTLFSLQQSIWAVLK